MPMAMVMPIASSVRNAQEEEHHRAEHHEHAIEADVPEIVFDRLVLFDAGDEVAGVADLHARIERRRIGLAHDLVDLGFELVRGLDASRARPVYEPG